MGWNDRLPEDPYTPPESFYRDRDDYEAWLEYVEMQLDKAEAGLTSQNLDPATFHRQLIQEPPARQSIGSRIWAIIFGQKIPENEKQEPQKDGREQNAEVPF